MVGVVSRWILFDRKGRVCAVDAILLLHRTHRLLLLSLTIILRHLPGSEPFKGQRIVMTRDRCGGCMSTACLMKLNARGMPRVFLQAAEQVLAFPSGDGIP